MKMITCALMLLLVNGITYLFALKDFSASEVRRRYITVSILYFIVALILSLFGY